MKQANKKMCFELDRLPYQFGDLEFHDPAWKQPLLALWNAMQSPNENPVLLIGPSGVGKNRLARIIHHSTRNNSQTNFVSVTCNRLGRLHSDSLERLNAEIFGCGKDAFTGVKVEQPSVFEQAEKGTVFFDEISELPISIQSSLSSVLQNRTYRKKGKTTDLPVDCRIVAATSHPLFKRAGELGESSELFRPDLLHSFKQNVIELPHLDETPAQIPYLAGLYASNTCADVSDST